MVARAGQALIFLLRMRVDKIIFELIDATLAKLPQHQRHMLEAEFLAMSQRTVMQRIEDRDRQRVGIHDMASEFEPFDISIMIETKQDKMVICCDPCSPEERMKDLFDAFSNHVRRRGFENEHGSDHMKPPKPKFGHSECSNGQLPDWLLPGYVPKEKEHPKYKGPKHL